MPAHRVQWLSKETTTPSYVQTEFGRGGQALPLAGEYSCGATALAMSVVWLIKNGFTQLLPGDRFAQPEDLIRVFNALAESHVAGPSVDEAWYPYVVRTYLALKGIIGPLQLTMNERPEIAPSVAWLTENNQDQTIVNFAVGWYAEDPKNPGVLQRNGQHWLTLLATDPVRGILIINNPSPETFAPGPNEPARNPQRIGTAPFSGRTEPALPHLSYTQTRDHFNHPRGPMHAILETAYAWRIDTSALPSSAGYVPQPFEIKTLQFMSGEWAALEVIAPLQGPGGILKWGRAELILTNTNTTSGTNEIREGLLVSTQISETPFGTGSIILLGSGGLALRPGGGSETGVTLAVAVGNESHVTFGGGNRLELDRGAHTSLAVRIGGRTDSRTPNLVRSGPGSTLCIIPQFGLGQLGQREQLLVAGETGNLPTVINGMVDPSIVAQDRDGSGEFLTYEENGFVPATTMSSLKMPIEAATPTTVYAVKSNQEIADGQTATAYAICIGPHTIQSAGGKTTLQIGNLRSSAQAGVNLNGGTIAATTLQFGSREGLIYTSPSGGTITSHISGQGGITCFGPGTLKLTGTNSYSGGTVVNSGQVIVANARGTGLGSDDVLVRAGGTLLVDGDGAHVTGKLALERDSHVILAGGTIGGIAVKYRGHECKGGILEGFGTIAGPSHVSGTISAGKNIGFLTFQDKVSFTVTSVHWTLTALDDTPGHEGTHWNALVCNTPTSLGTPHDHIAVILDFRGIPGPDSAHPFWRHRHRWLLARLALGSQSNCDPRNSIFTGGSFGMTITQTPTSDDVHITYYPV